MELCGFACRGWRDLDDQAVFLKHDLLEWQDGRRRVEAGSVGGRQFKNCWAGETARGGSGEMGKGDAVSRGGGGRQGLGPCGVFRCPT